MMRRLLARKIVTNLVAKRRKKTKPGPRESGGACFELHGKEHLLLGCVGVGDTFLSGTGEVTAVDCYHYPKLTGDGSASGHSLLMDTLVLAEEADEKSEIKDRHFKDAILVGPAVLAPMQKVQMQNVKFEVPRNALFIEVPATQRMSGVIGLKHVTFENCTFRNIALIGLSKTINEYRRSISG